MKTRKRGKKIGATAWPLQNCRQAPADTGALQGFAAWRKNRPKWPPPGGTKLAAMVL